MMSGIYLAQDRVKWPIYCNESSRSTNGRWFFEHVKILPAF